MLLQVASGGVKIGECRQPACRIINVDQRSYRRALGSQTSDGHNHQSGSAHHNRHVDSVVAEVLVLVICGEPRDWL